MGGFLSAAWREDQSTTRPPSTPVPSRPSEAHVARIRGSELHRNGNFVQAISQFERAVSCGSPEAEDFNMIGLSQHALENDVSAVVSFTKALKVEPEETVYLANRAMAYCFLGEYDLGIKDCEAILQKDTESASGSLWRGLCYFGKEKYALALADHEQHLARVGRFSSPQRLTSLLNRARTFCYLNKYEEAVEDLTQCLSIVPLNRHVFGHRGLAFIGLKAYEEAVGDLTRSLDGETKQRIRVRRLLRRAFAYCQLGEFEKANDDLRGMSEKDFEDQMVRLRQTLRASPWVGHEFLRFLPDQYQLDFERVGGKLEGRSAQILRDIIEDELFGVTTTRLADVLPFLKHGFSVKLVSDEGEILASPVLLSSPMIQYVGGEKSTEVSCRRFGAISTEAFFRVLCGHAPIFSQLSILEKLFSDLQMDRHRLIVCHEVERLASDNLKGLVRLACSCLPTIPPFTVDDLNKNVDFVIPRFSLLQKAIIRALDTHSRAIRENGAFLAVLRPYCWGRGLIPDSDSVWTDELPPTQSSSISFCDLFQERCTKLFQRDVSRTQHFNLYYREGGSCSNITLCTLDGGEEKAHIEILACRSLFFAKLFASPWSETEKYKQTGSITLEIWSHTELKHLLRWFYLREISESADLRSLLFLVTHAEVAGEQRLLSAVKNALRAEIEQQGASLVASLGEAIDLWKDLPQKFKDWIAHRFSDFVPNWPDLRESLREGFQDREHRS